MGKRDVSGGAGRQRAPNADRVPQFPWPETQWAKEAAAEFNAPVRTAVESDDFKALQKAISEQNANPDVIAARLIEDALETVHLDPRVHRDAPWLGHFAMLLRELLADHVPGMTLVEMLAPLQKALSQHGGGRPRKVDPAAVARTRRHLDAAWHPAPTQETARRLGTTDRNIRKIAAAQKKNKPG